MAVDGTKRGRRNGTRHVDGGRAFIRTLVDNPDYRVQFERQFVAALEGEDSIKAVDSFVKLFEHGYGRPPQALDVSHSTGDGPLEFRILDVTGATFAFGGGDLPTRSVPLPTAATE